MDFAKLLVLYNALSRRSLTEEEKLELTKFVCELFKIKSSEDIKENVKNIEKYFGVGEH